MTGGVVTDESTRVWFITGASSGIGKTLAEQVLDDGDTVVGTFREAAEADAFSRSFPGRSVGTVADVRDAAEVAAAVGQAIDAAGRVDVVVNAAGYAIVGAVEELSSVELSEQINVNLLGVHRVLRAALPWMRERGHGHIVNISSVGGQVGAAGLGAYDASKAALELLSEALRAEVGPLGIRVIIVEPGNIRTKWAGRSMEFAKRRIEAYDATAGAMRTSMQQLDGQQEGDPAVVAADIRAAVSAADPPLRLVIGSEAHQWIEDKLREEESDVSRWKPSSASS
jgi:NAD(P)-dependent dehydrogenase (short-subunit alcohol dehydrogenase family)